MRVESTAIAPACSRRPLRMQRGLTPGAEQRTQTQTTTTVAQVKPRSAALESLLAPIHFRLLITQQPITDEFLAEQVDHMIRLLCPDAASPDRALLGVFHEVRVALSVL